MGRRGLHNEGAELMTQRLAGKIDIDFEPRAGCSPWSACCTRRVSSAMKMDGTRLPQRLA